MDIANRRKTVDKIGQARALLQEAADDGQWFDARTADRIEQALVAVATTEHFAGRDLARMEKDLIHKPNADLTGSLKLGKG